jgi:hypothetical protein
MYRPVMNMNERRGQGPKNHSGVVNLQRSLTVQMLSNNLGPV